MRTSWILIVDDDANFCRSMLRALESRRLQATSCHRGAAALDLLREGRLLPDLLVTDAHLPDFSGLELIRALADEGIFLPTLLVSGIGASMPMEQMRRFGCHAFLEKPFPTGVFLEQVLALLRPDREDARTPGQHPPPSTPLRASVFRNASVRF
jgi:DNA-binding response OmpR family regulator